MFSYRHSFHAGNFADVVKHISFIGLLRALQKKTKPFYVQDTHGGIGMYDLSATEAQKNAEFERGIASIWNVSTSPELIQDYLETVKKFNPHGKLEYYPGSPRLGQAYLRPGDRLVTTELNRADYESLKAEFSHGKNVAVHLLDAYQGLKAFLPPDERRGVVLIDPPYELKDEYTRLVAGVEEAYRRWPTGIYAIWYPVMSQSQQKNFLSALQKTGIRKILSSELLIRPIQQQKQMCGTGMVIINPPWQFDESLKELLNWLLPYLSDKDSVDQILGSVNVEWLVPE